MPTPYIRLRNLDEVTKGLDPKAIQYASRVAARATLLQAENYAKDYPPATAANRPGRWTTDAHGYARAQGFYERGRGYWSPIMQKKTLYQSSLGGKILKSKGVQLAKGTQKGIVAGYKLTATSERLREAWAVSFLSNGARATNKASYAPYVHGEEQSSLMDVIGWEKMRVHVQAAIDSGMFTKAFRDAYAKRTAG